MIEDFEVRPNPHAVDTKSVEVATSSRYTAYLPKFTVHPGWNFAGETSGLYIRREHTESDEYGNRSIIESVDGPFKPDVISGREYGFTFDELRLYCDYDYTDAWGDRHYSRALEMWLVANYDGTGKVIVKNGKVVIHNGKVVIDR